MSHATRAALVSQLEDLEARRSRAVGATARAYDDFINRLRRRLEGN